MSNADNATASPEFPEAKQRPAHRLGWLWLMPVVALCVVVWLVTQSLGQRGMPVTVSFKDGHGLKAGDAVRYRGIPVGQVEKLKLSADLSGIEVTLRLQAGAADVARGGARFWIVRPRLDLDGAQGLETVIGANYIGLIPGSGDPIREFQGLEQPPLMALAESGGLEILLTTPGQGNLRAGAPVSYRQVVIGAILSVDLARDAGSVVARAYIKPRYASLIRRHSRFWRVSAAHISAGFSGLSLDVESIRGLLLGGVTLATPPDAGAPVAQRARFRLYDEPRQSWLDWLPFVALDAAPATGAQPSLLSATLSWRYRSYLYLYWAMDELRRGWLLPVAGGLLGPADMLRPPADALTDSVELRFDDEPQPMVPLLPVTAGVALLATRGDWPIWPASRIHPIDEPRDLLIIADPDTPARFIEATNIRVEDGRWQLSREVPFDPAWHGAAVLSAADGALVGLLLIDAEGAGIARLPAVLPDAAASAETAAVVIPEQPAADD